MQRKSRRQGAGGRLQGAGEEEREREEREEAAGSSYRC